MKKCLNELERVVSELDVCLELGYEVGGLTAAEIEKTNNAIKLGEMLMEHARQGHWRFTPAIDAYLAKYPKLA